MQQEKISSIIRDRVPRFILDEYPTFVSFLDKYNQFLESDRTVNISLEEFVAILDQVTVLDVDMIERPTLVDSVSSLDIVKNIFETTYADDSGIYLINGKYLDDPVMAMDNVLSREIGMLFSEGPYLVNISDYVDPSYLLVSPLVTDEFVITDITRGVVETILALDSATKTSSKALADSSTSSDTLQPFSVGLGKSETVSSSEVVSVGTERSAAETVSFLDAAAKTLATNRLEFLSSIADVITSKSVGQAKQDTQSVVDAIVEKIAYPLYQETAQAIENFSIQETNTTQEVATSAENIQTIGVAKQILDSIMALDLISVSITYGYVDSVTATESISIILESTLSETGDYMSTIDYVPTEYFGGSIDDYLTAE